MEIRVSFCSSIEILCDEGRVSIDSDCISASFYKLQIITEPYRIRFYRCLSIDLKITPTTLYQLQHTGPVLQLMLLSQIFNSTSSGSVDLGPQLCSGDPLYLAQLESKYFEEVGASLFLDSHLASIEGTGRLSLQV